MREARDNIPTRSRETRMILSRAIAPAKCDTVHEALKTGVMTMRFSVSARLGYRVKQHTPFVFNVQAERFPGQESFRRRCGLIRTWQWKTGPYPRAATAISV
jgi:hypothetical protein